MNLRDKAILNWVNKTHSNLTPLFNKAIGEMDGSNPITDGLRLIASIAFEAGRQFQIDNPKLELDNPNVYLFPEDGK